MKPKAISTISTVPADSGTERNMLSGSSGSVARVSQKMKTAKLTTRARQEDERRGSPQPHSGALMRAQIEAEHRAGQQHDARDVEGARRVLGTVVPEDHQAHQPAR